MLIEALALADPIPFRAARLRSVAPVARPLAPPTLAGLFAGQPRETVAAGQPLFWRGDAAAHVFQVVSGALRIVRILGDGRRVIVGFRFAGDFVGVGEPQAYVHTAEAIGPVEMRRLGRARFEARIDADAALRPQLLAQLQAEMRAAQEQAVLLARKTAEERVCSFLLALAGQHRARGNVVELPMTRLDIADYLGLTIETVSRAMTRLQATGVIDQQGRRLVVLRQPGRLAALAGEAEDEAGELALSARH